MKTFLSKLFSLALIFILCVSLVGCFVEYDPADDTSTPGDDSGSSDSSDSTGSQGTEKVTINETVCFEYEGFKATAKSIEGNSIKFLFENNGTAQYAISVDEVIVNDCIISSFFSETVSPGKKSNKSLDISSSQLKEAGIEVISKVTINSHIYNPDTYVTIKELEPFTIKTSAYDKMEARDTSGTLVYSDNDMKVIIKAVKHDSIFGNSLLLYIESNRTEDIGVSCESLSVNGFMLTKPLFSKTLFPGTYIVSELDIYSTSLEENGITDIESIEFILKFYSKTTYKELFRTEEIVYEVKK